MTQDDKSSTAQPLHPILLLPREMTAPILEWLHLTDTIKLLQASRRFRNYFSLSPNEYRIARRQLQRHCHGVLGSSRKPAYFTEAFHKLPMAYTLALISCDGFREGILAVAFLGNTSLAIARSHWVISHDWRACVPWTEPFEQPKRVELLMQKALEFGLVDVSFIAWPLERPSGLGIYQLACRFALRVAAMLDSVPLAMKVIDLAIKKNPADGPRLRREAVIAACITGAAGIAEHLLGPQTDPDVDQVNINPNTEIDKGGNTLLSLAAEFGRVDVARLLLAHGADINVRCRAAGRAPLHHAANVGHLDVVRVLLEEGADVDYKDSQNSTPLILAGYAQKDSLAIAQLLVEKGANILARDDDGYTPLHIALRQDNVDMVRFLIESVADVDCLSKYNLPLLKMAACKGLRDVAELLVEKGARIDARFHDGATPLSRAVSWGRVDVARFLLDMGAQIDCRNESGEETPLIQAAQGGHLEVVKLLVERGADVGARNKAGRTAREEAEKGRREAIVKFLATKESQSVLEGTASEASSPRDILGSLRGVGGE
ncbi:hypothetical protein HDU96_009808 [Phlyctochytrium bullatum]|nr:hypothetical protein HDU96_009808 [Phlyctochytrium bullatum]